MNVPTPQNKSYELKTHDLAYLISITIDSDNIIIIFAKDNYVQKEF